MMMNMLIDGSVSITSSCIISTTQTHLGKIELQVVQHLTCLCIHPMCWHKELKTKLTDEEHYHVLLLESCILLEGTVNVQFLYSTHFLMRRCWKINKYDLNTALQRLFSPNLSVIDCLPCLFWLILEVMTDRRPIFVFNCCLLLLWEWWGHMQHRRIALKFIVIEYNYSFTAQRVI